MGGSTPRASIVRRAGYAGVEGEGGPPLADLVVREAKRPNTEDDLSAIAPRRLPGANPGMPRI
jgi:hypothetical protein